MRSAYEAWKARDVRSFADDHARTLTHVSAHVDPVPTLGHRWIGPLKHVARVDRARLMQPWLRAMPNTSCQ